MIGWDAISKAQFTGKANSAILRFSDRNFGGLPCWFVSAVNAAKQGESHVAALKRMLRTVGRKCLLVIEWRGVGGRVSQERRQQLHKRRRNIDI